MADLVFDFNIKKTATIFEEDDNFARVLSQYGLYYPDTSIDIINPLRTELYTKIATLLLSNYDYISSKSIEELWSERYKIIELEIIFGINNIIDEKLFKQLYFTFKYSTVKHFFQDNWTSFLPDIDATEILEKPRKKIFYEAFMKEYDRLVDVIDTIKNIADVDKVDNAYLPYLIQLLGYEKIDSEFLTNSSFRELAKNIIEIYRIKGTNYSFELFFNFLGLGIDIKEYWFDKRLYDSNVSINPYTNISDKDDFRFYLTIYNPTEYIPNGMISPYQVMENDLTDIMSHLEFARRINNDEPILDILDDFTFFKTNFIQYSIRRIGTNESGADSFDSEDLELINKYADFLTPIFITRILSLNASEMEDEAGILVLTEDIAKALVFDLETIETIREFLDSFERAVLSFSVETLSVTEETLKHINPFYEDEASGEWIMEDSQDVPNNLTDELSITYEVIT